MVVGIIVLIVVGIIFWIVVGITLDIVVWILFEIVEGIITADSFLWIGIVVSDSLNIIWWTSLTVYPAATLIQYYGWDKIVIINRDSTTQDRFADILFHESLGKVFLEIKV